MVTFVSFPTLSSSNFSLRSDSSRNRIDLVVISSRSTWVAFNQVKAALVFLVWFQKTCLWDWYEKSFSFAIGISTIICFERYYFWKPVWCLLMSIKKSDISDEKITHRPHNLSKFRFYHSFLCFSFDSIAGKIL